MGIAYRSEIDGLRAIAVSAVVLFHAGIGQAGYVGVDIFFVISGYLITALLLREHASTGRIDLMDFYARRVRRIFPAVIVVIAAVLAVAPLFLDFRALISATDSATASALFLANVFFQAKSDNYFAEAAELMPLLHLWSLSVEEQFYLLWPAMLIGLLRYQARIIPAIAVLALASFGLAELLMQSDPPAAFYQMPARCWELAAGGLIAAMPVRRLPGWAGWLGLMIVLDACLVPLPHFPGYGALPAVGGACLLIATIHGGGSNALLASRPIVGTGLISYGLYLWHWPLLALYAVVGGNSLVTRLYLCLLAVLLAVGSYRYIEQPLRRKGSNRTAMAFGFGAFAALALTAFATARLEAQTPEAIASRDVPVNPCQNTTDTCESDPGRPLRIGIVGDSMGHAWQPLAWSLAQRRGVSAVSYSRDGCKPALGYDHPGRPQCRAWVDAVVPRLAGLDTVIIAGRWDFEPEGTSAMAATMDALRGVRRVIVLGPPPWLRAPAPTCIEGNDLARCSISRAEYLRRSGSARAVLLALVAAHPNAEYIELADWLCDARQCPATRDGMVLYSDHNHISQTAAQVYAEQFR